jgi:hypothetical protein
MKSSDKSLWLHVNAYALIGATFGLIAMIGTFVSLWTAIDRNEGAGSDQLFLGARIGQGSTNGGEMTPRPHDARRCVRSVAAGNW